jgi:outer membrane protein assembly factor BamB
MTRKRVALAGGLVLLLVAGAVVGYALYRRHEFRNVHGSSSVEFVTTDAPKPPPPPPGIEWGLYGYDQQGTRNADYRLRPPYRLRWTFHWKKLIEFPPVVGYGRVFFATWDGKFFALNAHTGRVAWHHVTNRCGWGSPALWRHLVFVTYIGHACAADVPGNDGIVDAYDARTGKLLWRFELGPCESSPLIVNGLLYVGDWRGKVYALDARTGRLRWSYQTGGKVKGSATYAGGRIYIGSYDNNVYAFTARKGKLVWRSSAQQRLGPSGTFYSTPAIAFGRVYIGSTDSKVYSYGATSGKLRWSYTTGGYVYASPAIYGRLVLVGSYDHTFYAFDAATGAVRWRFRANGAISGSASVVNGIVYFSTFGHRTYGLNAATGKLIWQWPDGEYTPAVADKRHLFVVGYTRIFAFVERHRRAAR